MFSFDLFHQDPLDPCKEIQASNTIQQTALFGKFENSSLIQDFSGRGVERI